jgi:fructokinase
MNRGAAFDNVHLENSQLASIETLKPDWIYFGTLAQTSQPSQLILRSFLDCLPSVKCFYDMNLRDGHWNLPLVQRLSSLASIVKLNETEAETLFRLAKPNERFSLEQFCRHWSSAYCVDTICVTLGGKGCAIFRNNGFYLFDGFSVEVADTVGAGDAFAAAFLHGYGLEWSVPTTATFSNALGALVASRAGATPAWTVDECRQFIAAHRFRVPEELGTGQGDLR